MTDASYAKWVGRGNAHLAAGRAIDALVCYRQALRGNENGGEARFQLGRIAWQLGNTADAIGLWRRVADGSHGESLHGEDSPGEDSRGEGSSPVGALAWRALADSLAMLGRFDEAAKAAAEVLAQRPQSKRMRWLGALLDVARGRSVGAQEADAAFGAREPWPLALIAAVTSRLVAGHAADGLRAPDDLVRSALDAAWRAATEGPVLRGTEDALRVVARNLATAGDERASAVATRYEAVCASLAAGSAPACWPQRAAGGPLRVGVLRSSETVAHDAVAHRAAGDDLVTALESAFGSRSAQSNANAVCALTVVDPATVPPDADAAARMLATRDFDVLIDAGGLAHPVGPLLALRPARRLWGFASTAALTTPALVDRVFVGAPGEVVAALVDETTRVDGPARDAAPVETPADLAARRDAAVIAHRDGVPDAARAGYDWVLARQPGDPQTHYLRAMLERDRGNTDEA
ncbi:MAG TPA: tetratricopeptide repeat protein, partial [Casimicrobiaceae bacterium]